MNTVKIVVTICLLSVTCSTGSNGIIDTNNITAINNINDIFDISDIIDININDIIDSNDIINDILSTSNDMGGASQFLPQDYMNNVFTSLGATSSMSGKSSNAAAANSVDVFREAFNLLWKFYLPVPGNLSTAAPNYNLSETCSQQVTFMHSLAANSTHPMPPWLSQMVDSWAKPSDGILNGKYNFFGVMEQCLKVEEKEPGTFDGRYCNVILGFSPVFVPSYSTCMPAGCQPHEMQKSGRKLLQGFYKKHPAVSSMYPLALGWLCATALAFTAVFDLSAYNFFMSTAVLSRTASFFYAAFEILAWSIAVAWVVMNCAMGLAGPVNFFLSHPMWQPLSRLSFGVYLVSVPIQYLIAASFQQNIYITYNLLLLLWCGVMTISFLGAFALSLLAEAPVINLLKLIK